MKSDHHQGVSAGTHNAFATRMRWVGAGSQNFPRYCPDKAVATSVIHQWCMAWDRWHKQQPARVQGGGDRRWKNEGGTAQSYTELFFQWQRIPRSASGIISAGEIVFTANI